MVGVLSAQEAGRFPQRDSTAIEAERGHSCPQQSPNTHTPGIFRQHPDSQECPNSGATPGLHRLRAGAYGVHSEALPALGRQGSLRAHRAKESAGHQYGAAFHH